MSENVVPFRSDGTPRRPLSHLQSYVRLAQAVAIFCSLVAGTSIAMAFWDSSTGLHGTVMPLLGGILVAFGLGALWHKAIHFAAHARDGFSKGVLAAICLGGALMAGATSSLGFATILSGRAALNLHQYEAVEAQVSTLRAAWRQADRQREIISALDEASAAWRSFAEGEGRWGLISGSAGRKVIYDLTSGIADRYEVRATDAEDQFATIEARHRETEKLLNDEHDLVGRDDRAFDDAANSSQASLTAIADFDLRPLAEGVAVVDFRTVIPDRSKVEQIEAKAKAITARLEQQVRAVTAEQEDIPVPSYRAITQRDAVIEFASSEAAPGWIVALGLDCLLPGLFVLLVFAATREPPIVNGAAPPPRHPVEPGNDAPLPA